ncbi:DUF485 domain-containing protein [Streptomyces sp. NBC_00557]|uniref:DUF485 domain-containing protein n=1 Tax=Streptomyces sp. NBC_00557 TaxID=2975776 RepID=UPI002E81FCA6|nr:DUF485 domain-containing protein [Streptomyces sp. NBC_00557]WUC36512.1 DUF485 domain-containing protein [Streptomyces sp. NBC_00557]
MSQDPPHPSYDPLQPYPAPFPPAHDRPPAPYGPPHLTYPWQPAPPPPPRPERRADREPVGHHSDLRVLRSAYRWQRRTATLTALGYFTLFLVLSACAPGVMTRTVADGIPAGLLLAVAQLPVTWLAIALYEHTARRHVDPLADRIRKEAELNARRGALR